MSTNTILKNPTGFGFSIKHKSKPYGTMSVPKIDLSKPVIKYKATNTKSVKTINSKKGGRKTYRKTKTHGKKHRGKTHKKIRRKTHKKK
jgi:hypothetical protein|tara:strand:+ start:14163 stop:14429 length:267 start_codon:yes stop_codon:yes gene_type:complete